MSRNQGLVEVTCEHCSEDFDAPRSMKGGLANCPACKRATKVSGGAEPLFWLIVAGSIFAGLFFTAMATLAAGWEVGVAVFVLSLIVGGIALAAS